MNRPRYDSAMFWLAFGTAAAVIGLALMTIGATRSALGDNLLTSVWFDAGLGVLALGVLQLLWALWLYLAHRRVEATAKGTRGSPASPHVDPEGAEVEAVRGYYREREKLMDMWEKQEKDRRKS